MSFPPEKRIKLPEDVEVWENSLAYNYIFQTLHVLNDSIKQIPFDSPKIKITPVRCRGR